MAGAFCLPASLRAEEGPKQGGRLRYGVNDGSQQDSLEPGSWATVMCGAAFNGALCNNLVELLPDGSLAGDLAESWEEAEGATRWTFTLRKGVTFHDGRPFTPEDARQSLLHHMGENSTSGALAIVSQIEEIAVEGEDRLIVTLAQGNADFPICCRIITCRSSRRRRAAASTGKAASAPAPSSSTVSSRASRSDCSAIRIITSPACRISTRSSSSRSPTGPRG